MFLRQVNTFLLLMATLIPTVQTALDIYGAYTMIENDVEYIPWNSGLTLDDINNVPFLSWCALSCMHDIRCLTATFYPSIEKCILFNGDYSQGVRRSASSAQVIVMANRAQCNVTFTNQTTYATGHNPQSVTVADVNSDGKIDIVVANTGDNTINVLINKGDGSFINRTTYSTGANSMFVVTADVNGDNKTDIIVTNSNQNNIGVFLNTGNGLFRNQITYSTSTGPWSVAEADINGDTKPDIVVANNGANNVGVLFNTGNGTFTSQTTYLSSISLISVVVADVNNDKKLDIIAGNSAARTIVILVNKGNGTFLNPMSYSTGSNPHLMAVADVNGDNITDIIVPNYADDNIGVFLNRGNGTFTNQVTYSTGSGSGPYSVGVADINGDNKPDLVSANYKVNSFSVLLNNGDGTFSDRTIYSIGSGSNTPASLAVADLNEDGKPDIITANYNTDTVGVFLASC